MAGLSSPDFARLEDGYSLVGPGRGERGGRLGVGSDWWTESTEMVHTREQYV